MKVLLFVQTGDERPKYASDVTSRYIDGSGNSTWTRRACQKQRAADRWWLVECANAEAGRALIHAAELVAAARRFVGRNDAPACISGRLPEGRVLASGVRHA